MAEKPDKMLFSHETEAAESHVKRHGRHHRGAQQVHAEGEETALHTAQVRHRRDHHSGTPERA